MSPPFHFSLHTVRFDEDYHPSDKTRATTNFANLARGEHRQRNLRHTLRMIDHRFNALAHWDNPEGRRYHVELDIVSVALDMHAQGGPDSFPLMEMLQVHIVDAQDGRRIEGIVGNNFSSYLRDYDFSVRLPAYNAGRPSFGVPDDFGDLHGLLFRQFVQSAAYQARFAKPPVICISVASSKTYQRGGNQHPILGIEYRQSEPSSTDRYFEKMGMQVRFFMPPDAVAPLAFYCCGDLLRDYGNLELIGTISTMEAFQKIYRPEIYNANAPAGRVYQPRLDHEDYSLTQVVYDRVERSQLAVQQGRFAQDHFIEPYQQLLHITRKEATHV